MNDSADRPDARVVSSRYVVDRLARESGEMTDDDNAVGQPGMDERAHFVEIAIQQAMRRGDFDDLPGAGKPLPGLTQTHDPDWWIRQKIERENITGLGPPALSLRKENSELDARLDATPSEKVVRDTVADFNRRIVEARRQLQGGPPVVTPPRDVEAEVQRWRDRRIERQAAAREALEVREAELAAMTPRERRRARRGH